MKGSVISYLVRTESDSPFDFRLHEVPDVNDEDAVRNQVHNERGNMPPGAHLGWFE
jgi:hypothetical protein